MAEWLDYLDAQVGVGVYVWGAQGQSVADAGGKDGVRAWIERRYSSQSADKAKNRANAKKAYAYYQTLSAKIGVERVRFFDCSGLGMCFFQQMKGLSGDKSAAGLCAECAPIARAQARPGDFAFKSGSNGRVNHVGYVAADGRVIEARCSGEGVSKRALASGGWTRFGRHPLLAGEAAETGERTLRAGCVGEDVRALQTRLMALGCALPVWGADGEFGAETRRALIAFQRAEGIDADGVCGRETRAALSRAEAAKHGGR